MNAVSLSYVLVAIILFGAVTIAKKSEVLRDKNATVAVGGRRPYSLSRTQLYIWTVVIACCFIMACAWNGQFTGIINQSTTILLGISVTTLVGSSITDNSHADEGGEIAKMSVVRKRNVKTKDKSNFMVDILSDSKGVSINRFQSVVFSLIFICIFIYYFMVTGKFAEFGSSELTLMGISQAGYLGAKATEGSAPPAQNTPPPVNSEYEENPRGIELADPTDPSGEDIAPEGN